MLKDRHSGSSITIYKKLLKLNKKKDNPTKIWSKDLNRQFSKHIKMATTFMKRCSTSLLIRECKSNNEDHFTPTRNATVFWRGGE